MSRLIRRLARSAGATTIAATLLGGAVAHGALIPGLYGTGVDTNGALLGNAQTDPHYTLTVSPDPLYPGPNAVTLNPGFPVGPWVTEGPNSRWIVPNADQGSALPGNYVFRTTFDLTGFDPASAKIEGNWAVDNSGTDIRLNGTSLGIVNNNGFAALTPFTINTGFVAGTNVLEFLVNNADDGTGNRGPIGLRVDLVGSVDVPGEPPAIVLQPVSQRAIVGDTVTFSVVALAPNMSEVSYQWRFNSNNIVGAEGTNLVLTGVTTNESGYYDVVVANFDGETNSVPALLTVSLPIPGIYNTGVGNDGVALADNSTDPHYTLVINPDSASTSAIVQNSTAFPIVSGPWIANTTNSKWIGPRFDTSGAAGGQYTYRLQFDLSGFDPSTAYLVGSWTSDNQGQDILLNGISKGIAQGGNFDSLNGFSITSGFVSGINTLEFRVNNEGAGYTGLRLQNFRGGALPSTSGAVPPSILTQPSSVVALTGENVSFSVLADGTPPLRYQWYRNAAILNDATNQTLTLNGVTTNNNASFFVAVSNDQGSSNSVTVTLTVLPPIPGLFNTGVDNSGALIPDNSPDPHYFLVVNPDTNNPPPVAISYGGWPVAPAGPYAANGPTSKWLFPPGNDGTNSAHGLHVFATQFDLTGLDPNTAFIRGQWGADDNVLDVVLNGRSLGLQCLTGFGSLSSFSITNGFVGGVNTIAFICNNGGDGFVQNPMGLRVEMRGSAQPTTCIWPNPTLIRAAPGAGNQQVTVVLPPGLNQSSAVQVTVTSANPAVAEPAGATAGSLTLNFAAGGPSSQAFAVNAKTLGSTVFTLDSVSACVGTNITVQVGETLVANPSFEDNYNTAFPHYSAINNWPQLKPGGTGVNDSSGPFWDNGANPDRSRVAFAQGTGGIFQEIWGLVPGKRYWLQFSYNVRNCCGGTMNLIVRFNGKELIAIPNIGYVGGANPFPSVAIPFTANADYGLLEFATLAVGDASFVIDAVSLVQRDDGEVVMANPSFEASGIPAWPGYIQPGPIAGWTGTGSYGVNRSGEGPFADNGTAQDQRNVLLLQNDGASVSQLINNLTPGGSYMLSFAYNARAGNTPRLRATVDGTTIFEQDVTPVGGSAPYYSASIVFTAAAASATLAFAQVSAAGDNTVLLDNVRIVPAPITLKIQRIAGGQVRISWPIYAAGYTLQSSTVVSGGYSDAGLPVTQEGNENVVYDTTATGNKFYVLMKL